MRFSRHLLVAVGLLSLAVITSAASNFCPDTFVTGAPNALETMVPGQPQVIKIGVRFSELSIFAGVATAVALSDGLGYPSQLVPLFDDSPSTANQIVIPADASAVQGLSGLDLDDHLAAGGYRPELANMGSQGEAKVMLGSLGPFYRAGLYAPSYTITALASTVSSLVPVPADLGLPDTIAGRASYALLNGSNADLIGRSVKVLELSRSLVAQILCTSGVHPVLRNDVTGVEQLLTAAGKTVPQTLSMLKATGLSITMNCTDSFTSQDDMETQLRTLVRQGRHFIVLGWQPWSLGDELGLVRIPLPEYDPQSFITTRLSDFPTTAGVPKTAFSDAEAAYPPQIVNFLRSLYIDPQRTIDLLQAARRGGFPTTVNGTASVAPFAAINITARSDLVDLTTAYANVSNVNRYLISEVPHLVNLTAAACLWLKEQQATVLFWGAKVSISFISPRQGSTSGFDVIRIVGSGYGLSAPLTAYASIGGQTCLDTRWIDSTVLECVTPQGIGQSLDVSIQVGSQTATLKGAFSYFPATVRAITSVDVSRQQNAGTALYISGANFYNAASLKCKFSGGTNGEMSVAATFINFTALACTPPPTFSGALQVSVTNDGQRYSTGLVLDTSALRFADGLSQAPPDFGPELAPPELTVAFLIDADLQKRDKTTIFESIMRSTVEEIITKNKILPFTNISVVSYYVKSPPASAPDQGDEGTELQNEQYRQQMADLYLRIRRAHLNLLGFVGPEQSVAAVPILQAMANYTVTYSLPSPAMISYAATDPALSSPTTYPTFLRVVPSALTYSCAMAQLLIEMQPTFIRNSALPANSSATVVHAVVTVDDAPSVAAYDAFRTCLENLGGGISRIAKIKTRDSAQVVATAMQASGISSASGAALTRLVFVAANREASVRVIQAGGLVTTPGTMLGKSGGNARVWIGLQNLADAITYNTADVAVASIIALQASPGKSSAAVKLREESLGSPLGPFIHDAVGAYLNSIDTLIRKVKSPDLRSYSSIELLDLVRGAAHPEAVTGYVGFAPSSNDPQSAEFEILNTFALATADIPTYPTVEQVSQILGTVTPGTSTISLNSSAKAVLWNGPDPDYVLPDRVTVLVPYPVHPDIVYYPQIGTFTVSPYDTPFDLQRDWVNYTLAWTTDPLTGVAKGLPPVYMGIPYSYGNKTIDTDLINRMFNGKITSDSGGIFPYIANELPNGFIVPNPANPFTIVDPDDPARPVGDQLHVFHPASLFWQTLEALADDINALSPATSPLKGAQVDVVAVPYYLEITKGLENAHVNLAPTLHDALYKIHTNGSGPAYPNVIGILGMHTNAGTRALADAVAAFPGPQTGIVNVDNAVLSRLNRLPIVSYGATTSEFSSPTNSPVSSLSSSSSSSSGRYRNLVRVVPPAYVDAASIVDMCRRARWTSVGVVYSGTLGSGDPLFDFGEEYVGLETYAAFVNEANRQGIRILAAVNVSNYLSASDVAQQPYRDPTITSLSQIGPGNYATDREAGLFGEMLAMKRAGARVIIMLTTKRAMCPVLRAAWAAGMVISAPPDMPFDKVGINGDYPTTLSRIAALRDGRDIYPSAQSSDVTTTATGSGSGGAYVDPFNGNISATLRAQSILNNASWAQGPDGLYYPPFATMEVYSWVLTSGNVLNQLPAACLAQIPPDYWAYMAASLRGDIGYARPLGREADGNIRRSIFSGYDSLGGKFPGGSALYGGMGPAPSWGSPTQQLSLLSRSVKRASKDGLYVSSTFLGGGMDTSTATVKTIITDTLFQTGYFAKSFSDLRVVLRTPSLRNALSPSDLQGAQAYFASPSKVKPWPASLLQRIVNASAPENTPHDLEELVMESRKLIADDLLPSSAADPLVDYPKRYDLAAIPATAPALKVLNNALKTFSMIGGPLNNPGQNAPSSFSAYVPVTGTKSIYSYPSSQDGTAVMDAAVVGAVSQIALPHQVGMAHRGLRALLLSAAGAISDLQSVSNPDIILAYLRGRVPAKGLITEPTLAGDLGGTVPITPGSNDPFASSYDLVNRQGPHANALVRVGSVADRGYVRFMGCPPGSEPDGDYKCRACPVNSWKSESGSQPCSSCPYAGKTRSRMITRGKTGSKGPSECLCPVGFYVLPQPTEPEDPGTICVPCVRSMQCDKVHLLLPNVRNTPGFWRGDAGSPYFFPCLKTAHCNVSSSPTLQPLTNSYEATSMNGTTCSGNTEGPLCDTCIKGYGKTSSGLCEVCPAGGMMYLSLALPCLFAVLLVAVLASMQVGTSPSYVTWRRINNTKLLISFLQVNAVLLSLDLEWPDTVKKYFNISHLSSAVNLSWVAWECALSSLNYPVQLQVFFFYMMSPVGLLIFCTGLILLTGTCAKSTLGEGESNNAQKTLEKAAVGNAAGANKRSGGLSDVNKLGIGPSSAAGVDKKPQPSALRGHLSRWEREMESANKKEQKHAEKEKKKKEKAKAQKAAAASSGGGCCGCGSRKKQPTAAATSDKSPRFRESTTGFKSPVDLVAFNPKNAPKTPTTTTPTPSNGGGGDATATSTSRSRGPAPLVALLEDGEVGDNNKNNGKKQRAGSTAAAGAADLDKAPTTAVSTTLKTAGSSSNLVPRFMLPSVRPPPLSGGDAALTSGPKMRSNSLSSAGTASTRDALLNTANDSRRDSAISTGNASSGRATATDSSGGEDPIKGSSRALLKGSNKDNNNKDNNKDSRARSAPAGPRTDGAAAAGASPVPNFPAIAAAAGVATAGDVVPSSGASWVSGSSEGGPSRSSDSSSTSSDDDDSSDDDEDKQEQEEEESDFDLEAEETEVTTLNDLYRPLRNADGTRYVSPLEQDFMAVMRNREKSCGARYSYLIDLSMAVLTIGLFLLYPTLLNVVFTSIDCTYVGPTSFAPSNNTLTLPYNTLVPLNATAAALAAATTTTTSTSTSTSSASASPTPSSLLNNLTSSSQPMIFLSYIPSARSYLRADLAVRCDGQLYSSFFWPIAVAFCALYALGIPLLFLCLVYYNGPRRLHLGKGRIRIGGEDYMRLAHRLREVASWVKPGRTRARLYSHFGGPHEPVTVRLRAVFDALHSPYSASQQLQLWKNGHGGASGHKKHHHHHRHHHHHGEKRVNLQPPPLPQPQQRPSFQQLPSTSTFSGGAAASASSSASSAFSSSSMRSNPLLPTKSSSSSLTTTSTSMAARTSSSAALLAPTTAAAQPYRPAGIATAVLGNAAAASASGTGLATSTPRKTAFPPTAAAGGNTTSTPTNNSSSAGKPPLPGRRLSGGATAGSTAVATASAATAAGASAAEKKKKHVDESGTSSEEEEDEGTTSAESSDGSDETGSSSGEETGTTSTGTGSTGESESETGTESEEESEVEEQKKKASLPTAASAASAPTKSAPFRPPAASSASTSSTAIVLANAAAIMKKTSFSSPSGAITKKTSFASSHAPAAAPAPAPPGIITGAQPQAYFNYNNKGAAAGGNLTPRAVAFATSAVGGGAGALRGGVGGAMVTRLPMRMPPAGGSSSSVISANKAFAYVSAMGNTSGIGPSGAVFVNQFVRDLSFGLRPVAREDFTSTSLVIQRNVSLSALLENAFEESQMIADENALLLSISTAAASANDGADIPGGGGCCSSSRDPAAAAKDESFALAASSTLFGSGTLVGETLAHRLVRAWTRDQRESAAAIYKRYGNFDVYDDEDDYVDEEEEEEMQQGEDGDLDGIIDEGVHKPGGQRRNSQGSVGGRRRSSLGGASISSKNGGKALRRGSGRVLDDDDDEIRSRISDKMTATVLMRSPSFSGHATTTLNNERVPPKGILLNNKSVPVGLARTSSRARVGSTASGGAFPVSPGRSPSASFIRLPINEAAAEAAEGGASGVGSSISSDGTHKKAAKRMASTRKAGGAAVVDSSGGNGNAIAGGGVGGAGAVHDWPTYPGSLYPPGFPVEELQAREKRRGKANTDALLALTLLLTADKVEKVGAVQRRFGWLYVDYRPGAFAYEFWSTLRKGLLVVAAVALSERPALLQCIVCIMVLTLYLLVHQHVRPIIDISLLPPSNPDELIAQHRAAIDSQAALSSILEGGGAGKGFRNAGGERSSGGWSSSSGGLFGCFGRSSKGKSGGNGEIGDLEVNAAPISIGYLGQLQRRLMRNRAALALLQLDPADPLRLGAAIPEAALTPDPPMAELLMGGSATKVTFDREGATPQTAMVAMGANGGAGGAGAGGLTSGGGSAVSSGGGSASGSGVAAAAMNGDGASGASGVGAPGSPNVPASSSLTYEDLLLLNPSLLRPYHIACCSARARRLSRNSSQICCGSGGLPPANGEASASAGSNFCVCACPWWTMQASKLPEVASTSRLDRLGVAAQLLGLVMLFIYEAQQASKAAGTSQATGSATLVTAVMLINVGVIFLVCCTIAVDLWQELKLLMMRILSSDSFTAKQPSQDAKKDSKKDKKDDGSNSPEAEKKSDKKADGASADKDNGGGGNGKALMPGVAAVLMTEQAALAAFRRREDALIEQLLQAEKALGASE